MTTECTQEDARVVIQLLLSKSTLDPLLLIQLPSMTNLAMDSSDILLLMQELIPLNSLQNGAVMM